MFGLWLRNDKEFLPFRLEILCRGLSKGACVCEACLGGGGRCWS